MKAYVIHLPRSVDRHDHILGELSRSGVDYEFVAAIDGESLSDADWERLAHQPTVAKHPRWLTRGAVGCALSHQRAYERISVSHDPAALVLEDDAILPEDTQLLLEALQKHINDNEIILLYFRCFGPCVLSAHRAVSLPGHRRLMYPMDPTHIHTSPAYIIGRAAARALADAMIPVRACADSWAFYRNRGFLNSLRCVSPRPVAIRNDFKSTLNYLHDGRVNRMMTTVYRHRLFPIYQLTTLRRTMRTRKASRIQTVSDPSPLAPTSDT
jgi:glycosyl transferase, family 25